MVRLCQTVLPKHDTSRSILNVSFLLAFCHVLLSFVGGGPQANSAVSYWDQLSYDLVGILLHDLILVAVLGGFYVVMKYVLGFVFCEGGVPEAGIGNPTYNADVTDA